MNEPTHLRDGTPLSLCIASFPNELQIDAVGLWQVVNTLRRGYKLEESELNVSISKSIEALFAAGAVPVVGSAANTTWRLAPGFPLAEDKRVEAVLHYLTALGRDPDVGDLWFALPRLASPAE